MNSPFISAMTWRFVKKRQKGAQAFEFAMMLPFFIVILFLVLDFGLLTYNKAIITNATREAVRRGTLLTAANWNPTAIADVACRYARDSVITVDDGTKTTACTGSNDPVITVQPAVTAPPAFNDPVTVTITYAFEGFLIGKLFNLGVTNVNSGSAVTLTATTEMLHE